jgi:ATP-dependent RNA helicase RhlE
MSTTVQFSDLPLSAALQKALAAKGYTVPTPIQARAIPPIAEGRDLVGIAQTGTGKTAAFALPILHRLAQKSVPRGPRAPRALILTPTRELATQIADNIELYGAGLHLRHAVIFGGVGERAQINTLAAGLDIVVATPGRLLDLLGQGRLSLKSIEIFVLDEADRMLDMGFAPVVRKLIAGLPARRQSLLFSATMPAVICDIAKSLLHDPVRVEVTPEASTAERVEQRLCHVAQKNDKHPLLVSHLRQHSAGLVLVFSRTKHGADKIVRALERDGIRANAIHGNKSQGARERALEAFRTGSSRVLVATDIAARGIDVKGISLVINHDLPDEPEAYVHRIGRTARAGAEGLAISYCAPEELAVLKDVQRTIRQTIPVVTNHPFAPARTPSLDGPLPPHPQKVAQQQRQARPGRGPRPGRNDPRGQKGSGQSSRIGQSGNGQTSRGPQPATSARAADHPAQPAGGRLWRSRGRR